MLWGDAIQRDREQGLRAHLEPEVRPVLHMLDLRTHIQLSPKWMLIHLPLVALYTLQNIFLHRYSALHKQGQVLKTNKLK